MKSGAVVGSKAAMGAAQRIVSEMPPHELYIEAFAGSGAVGRLKRPSKLDVFIDADIETALRLKLSMPDRQVVCGDSTRIIVPESIPSEAVLYADPPYLMSVRRSQRRHYRCELSTDAEHDRLLVWLRRFRCRVMVSGYWSELYQARLEGWRTVTFTVATRRGAAHEWLWCNFPESPGRHDTRFMGEGSRERERIKRKVARWSRRVAAMSAGERAAVLSALADAGSAQWPAAPAPAPIRSRIDIPVDEEVLSQLRLL